MRKTPHRVSPEGTPTPDVNYALRLPADLFEAIRHQAQEQERSINAQIVWLLRGRAKRVVAPPREEAAS